MARTVETAFVGRPASLKRGEAMASEDEAKVEELRIILYRSTYESVRELLRAGDAPEHIRSELLPGVPDDPEDTKRAAVEDALGRRPPRW